MQLAIDGPQQGWEILAHVAKNSLFHYLYDFVFTDFNLTLSSAGEKILSSKPYSWHKNMTSELFCQFVKPIDESLLALSIIKFAKRGGECGGGEGWNITTKPIKVVLLTYCQTCINNGTYCQTCINSGICICYC